MSSATSQWREPKTGILATLWPNDSTWHSLYYHRNSEIYATISQMQTEEEARKTIWKKNVQGVIELAPVQRVKAVFYRYCIFFLLLVVVVAILYAMTTVPLWALMVVVGVSCMV